MENELVIIQGDYYGVEITFENIDYSLIENVAISSKDLNLCKLIDYDDNLGAWLFELTSNETSELVSGHYDYDITIKLTNGEKTTVVYEYGLCVREKKNKVNCYE